jgi:hypothetical protein
MPTHDNALLEELVQGGVDPYAEPSGVFRNLLGLTDAADIKAAEADAVSYRSKEIIGYSKDDQPLPIVDSLFKMIHVLRIALDTLGTEWQ